MYSMKRMEIKKISERIIKLFASSRLMKFVYANSDLKRAEFVLIGVPDESGSHSSRKGAKKGPDAIRNVAAERCVFKRNGNYSLAQVSSGKIQKKI